MESNSSSVIKLFSHPETNRLNCFDGSNFTRWKDKKTFLLTTLKVFYVLSEDLAVIPGPTPDESKDIKKERKKREEDELVCRGHILNSLTYHLYNLYSNLKSPKEIWTALETKYKNEKKGTDKFLAMNYFDFKLSYNQPVMDQIHELQILVSRLRDLDTVVPDSLQIGAILSKLPPSWNEYRKRVLHSPQSFTIEEFQTHLQIESENQLRDAKLFLKTNMNPKETSQVNVVGSNSRNKSGKTQNNLEVQKNGGIMKTKKKNRIRFHCGKKGHYIKECRFRLAEKGNTSENSNHANMVEKEEKELVAMVT